MSDEEMIWVESPPIRVDKRTEEPFRLWCQKLKARPGEWAMYPIKIHPMYPSKLNNGDFPWTYYGEFEATSRNTHLEGRKLPKVEVYARYVAKGLDNGKS